MQSWKKKKYAKQCEIDAENREVFFTFTEYVIPYKVAHIQEVIDSVVTHFTEKYPNKDVPCYHCENSGDVQIVSFASVASPLCGACRSALQTEIEETNNAFAIQETNYAAGTVGAVLFSLPCMLLTLLFFFLGKIAAISGMLHYYAAIKGYNRFKGKFDKIGFLITMVVGMALSVGGTAVAYIAYVTYKVKQGNPEYSIPSIIAFVIEALQTDAEVFQEFKQNLLFALIFCGIAILISAFGQFKATKTAKTDKIKATSKNSPKIHKILRI